MPRSVLHAAYVAWPAAVVALRLLTHVRRRCLIVAGLGYVIALALATTATPASVAVPLGLFVGGLVAVGGCLATARGVTFTVDQDTTYWQYDGKIPVGDRLVEVLGALVAIVGLVAMPWD